VLDVPKLLSGVIALCTVVFPTTLDAIPIELSEEDKESLVSTARAMGLEVGDENHVFKAELIGIDHKVEVKLHTEQSISNAQKVRKLFCERSKKRMEWRCKSRIYWLIQTTAEYDLSVAAPQDFEQYYEDYFSALRFIVETVGVTRRKGKLYRIHKVQDSYRAFFGPEDGCADLVVAKPVVANSNKSWVWDKRYISVCW
jgi:hypothetical protein